MRVFRPRSVHVRIAAGCNLGCMFCERENLPESSPGSGRRRRGTIQFTDGRPDLPIDHDMSLETWDLVKEKFMPYTDCMEIGGLGEPTLGKHFTQIASEIVAAGKQLFFFTNGHYLNLPHVLEAVGDRPHISISIDAGTPAGYRAIRKGELSKLVESVKAFREAKPEAVIDSQFTAIASNIDEIPAWVELCAELEIGRTEFGEQLLLVGADHHATSRVDESVRFHKDRTLAALETAVAIAQQNGLWLMSQLPAFSEHNANAGTDNSDPRKLRRWADLMFFGDNPCGGSGTCLKVGSLVLMRSGRTLPVESLKAGDYVATLSESGKRTNERVVRTKISNEALMRFTHEHGVFECSHSHLIPNPEFAAIPAHKWKVGDKLIGPSLFPSKVLSIEAGPVSEVCELELSGPNRLYFSGGAWHHNTLGLTKTDVVPEGFGTGLGHRLGIPEYTPSADEPQEIVTTSKELYIDTDGSVWSCLARHPIGDIRSGTWETVVDRNLAYQSWLSNWHYNRSNLNGSCKSCPRRK